MSESLRVPTTIAAGVTGERDGKTWKERERETVALFPRSHFSDDDDDDEEKRSKSAGSR